MKSSLLSAWTGMIVLFSAALFSCTSSPENGAEETPGGNAGEYTENTFYIHSVLRSDMVVQQNRPLTLWGKGTTGKTVTVTVDWNDGEFSAPVDGEGFWSLTVDVPAAPAGNPPHTIRFHYDGQQVEFGNILIGEVWFLSGQSNMQMEMARPEAGGHAGVEDYENEIAAADYPLLRFYNCNLNILPEPQWDGPGMWRVCSPATAGLLSGVGYYFGRKLVQELDIPVGLVVTAYGGVAGQGYTALEVLSSSAVLKAKYVDPYLADRESVQPTSRPGETYNAMVHPFFPLSVRGILWYQGESNAWEGDIYQIMERYKLEHWRRMFGRPELPYYFVQLAPCAWGIDKVPEVENPFYEGLPYFPVFREFQSKIRDQNDHCEMVVTMDVGDVDDIHPRKKRPVGERLARIALNRDYGRTEVSYLGPRYNSFSTEGGVTKVLFDHAEAGLETNDGAALQHFFVAGEDRVFHRADAEIHGNEIWLTCPEVPRVEAVRYAFLLYPITNLQNSSGLPAEPFRTDYWDQVTYRSR